MRRVGHPAPAPGVGVVDRRNGTVAFSTSPHLPVNSSPGGGGQGDTERPALALYGPGADENAKVQQREIQQSTGSSASELPAEFRDGLESFFNAVEGIE